MNGSRVRAFLAGSLFVGLLAYGSGGTYAAFFSRTSNGDGAGNSFAAGTVDLTDNDSGSAMFSLTGVRPSDPARSKCMTVTYGGSLDSDVRLYASASSTGVEQYVNLKVEWGTTTTGFGDCSGFTAIQTLYNGSLSGFPGGWAGGIVDPGNPWTTGEAHAYRFTVSLQNDPSAQGKTATATFSWEARNL